MRRPRDRPVASPDGADAFHAVRRRQGPAAAMIRTRSGDLVSLGRSHPDTINAACTISTRHSLRLPVGSRRGSGSPSRGCPATPAHCCAAH